LSGPNIPSPANQLLVSECNEEIEEGSISSEDAGSGSDLSDPEESDMAVDSRHNVVLSGKVTLSVLSTNTADTDDIARRSDAKVIIYFIFFGIGINDFLCCL
jgi:hypothetical protein